MSYLVQLHSIRFHGAHSDRNLGLFVSANQFLSTAHIFQDGRDGTQNVHTADHNTPGICVWSPPTGRLHNSQTVEATIIFTTLRWSQFYWLI